MSNVLTNALSRRTLLIVAAGIAPAFAAGSAVAAGLPQTAVSYQATPKDDKQCSNCKLFVEPNACKSVAGAIAPTGWCKLYIKKS